MMKRLQKYCQEVIEIDRIETFIISFKFLDDILKDTELLSTLSVLSFPIKHLIENTYRDPSTIYFAFARLRYFNPKFAWYPLNCYKIDNTYYHIFIRTTWLCRECKQLQHGLFIIPMIEHDCTLYQTPYPKLPKIFKKKPCDTCGKLLQCHFIL